jgi:hypothetical protein
MESDSLAKASFNYLVQIITINSKHHSYRRKTWTSIHLVRTLRMNSLNESLSHRIINAISSTAVLLRLLKNPIDFVCGQDWIRWYGDHPPQHLGNVWEQNKLISLTEYVLCPSNFLSC